MTYHCPVCQRSFAEPGFCPFDGKPLAAHAPSAAPTEPDGDAWADDPPSKIRALSAQASPSGVVAAMREAPSESEYDQLVGETLDGRYYVQRKIGEGGMGVVFAAKHAVIERPLAIKVLKREVMRDTATIKRFVQEAKAASRIGHPNIVDVTDFGTTPDGMTYSVMEYVDGTTLAVAIKEGAPFPPERSIRVATQIARALGAAHDKGIVHRDLKPENVFLIDRDDRPDFVKIVDFGIAKVLPIEGAPNEPRLTRAGSVFGTPEYMAPEQAAGRNDTDHRVDIYALGTILYEMTVGRTPHKSNSNVRTIAAQMLDPITPPSQVHPDLAVPKRLELAIMKALAKKREERFQTMPELIAELDEVVAYMKRDAATTMSLPPVPPGADPGATPASRRPKPETRKLHEPAFADGGAVVLPPVPQVLDEPEPEKPRRWPLVLVAMTLLAGGAGALYLTTRADRNDVRAAAPSDAAPVRGDAQLVAELADGGAVAATSDARLIAETAPDAGVHSLAHRDGGVVAVDPRHPKTVTVEVLTRPGETDVFLGHTYQGPSGVHIRAAYGAKLELECRAAHLKGKITVVFDGSRDSVMCTATRLPFCVEGLKNPIDDCEERPIAP